LSPGVPPKADKTYQWVLLTLEPPFEYDGADEGAGPERRKGILMPDGQTINPEIEVVDQFGNTFKFIYRGARGGADLRVFRPGHASRRQGVQVRKDALATAY